MYYSPTLCFHTANSQTCAVTEDVPGRILYDIQLASWRWGEFQPISTHEEGKRIRNVRPLKAGDNGRTRAELGVDAESVGIVAVLPRRGFYRAAHVSRESRCVPSRSAEQLLTCDSSSHLRNLSQDISRPV